MALKVFTVQEMVAAEKAADAAGVSYDQMMETAGRLVAEAISQRVDVAEKHVFILVGPGNNGGDGLVAGRYLAEAGANVAFYLFKPRNAQEDANYRQIMEMALALVEADQDEDYHALRTNLKSADILIDALLGTGVTRPVSGALAGIFEQVKAGLSIFFAGEGAADDLTSLRQIEVKKKVDSKPFIAAVDCPSGLNCDTGALDPLAFPADLTVTFAGPKRGHFHFPGAQAIGELVVADINIPNHLPEITNVALEIATAETAATFLPVRPADGHKGTFGTALIAAGSKHYFGAPVLAGRGAYRVGAGLVALMVPEVIRPTVATHLPEATYPPVSAADLLNEASARYLLENAGAYKSVLIGPGLDMAEDFLAALLGVAELSRADNNKQPLPPMIVDADGLNILATWPDWFMKLPSNTLLTPHPGEMARLMGVSLPALKKMDRVELAGSKAQEWGHVVLLKGAFTVVAAPDGRSTLLPFANSLLAVGGSGDVLAGVIVGLLAHGLEPYEAAVLGAYLHAAAGELAAEKYGRSGLLAGELADLIPLVRQRLRSAAS